MGNISSALDHSLDLLKDTYNYNHWIYSLLRPWLGNNVLEVGSGPGNLTRFLLDREQVLCIEPNVLYCSQLEKLAAVHRNITIENGDDRLLEEQQYPNRYDTLICLNVLEHIENDMETLQRFYNTLSNNGVLLLYVPASQWAYGTLDRNMGHFRRYNKIILKERVRQVGFEIVRCRYVNLIGVFGWWWTARCLKDSFINPQKARLVDKWVPILSALENICPPLVGQSLFLVAKKMGAGV